MNSIWPLLEYLVQTFAPPTIALIFGGFAWYAERIGVVDLKMGSTRITLTKGGNPLLFKAIFILLPQVACSIVLIYWLESW